MPPREWMYNYDTRSNYDKLKTALEWNNLPVPYHWDDDDMTIFDRACFGEIPDIKGHKSDE